MNNNVCSIQNSQENIDCLAAQRNLYAKAKNVLKIQIFLDLPILMITTGISLALNNQALAQKLGLQQPLDLSWLVAAVSVIIAVIDFAILSPLKNSYREKAAKIQELFDTKVLEIKWNEIVAGKQPTPEEIYRSAISTKNNQQAISDLYDWYPKSLAPLPHYAARAICQRCNLSWDSKIRIDFSTLNLTIGIVFFLVLLSISLYINPTLNNFFCFSLAPATPFLLFSSRQWRENKDAALRLIELRELSNSVWDRILSGEENLFENDARKLQDQIFENRKKNPLIFDYFYELKKSAQEEEMRYSSNQLANEFQEAKKKS